MRYPLARYSEEPVTGYPLTKDELRILALHWSDKYLDTSVFCCLYGQTGTTDLRMWDYTYDRLEKIAAILGKDEIDKVHDEVVAAARQRMGEELWNAYREGRPVFLEQIEAEDAQKQASAKNEEEI